MRMKDTLCPISIDCRKIFIPTTCYTCQLEKMMYSIKLHGVKVFDGYSSIIFSCINVQHHNLSYFKFHNCHILMQQLLHCLRCSLHVKTVCSSVIQLFKFYREFVLERVRVEDSIVREED